MAKKTDGATEQATEFQELSTGVDYASSGEWATLKEGDVYEGELKDALLLAGEKPGDKPRVAFVIAEPHGVTNIGERAELKSIRKLRLGSLVRIEVKGKEDIGNNRSVWRFRVSAKPSADRKQPIAQDKLMAQYEQLNACPF